MFFKNITVPSTYYLIDSPRKLSWVYNELVNSSEFAYDIETTNPTGKNKKKELAYKKIHKVRVAGVAFAWGRKEVTSPWTPGNACYIPLLNPAEEPVWGDRQDAVLDLLRKLLMTSIPKAAHNSKFDVKESYLLEGIKVVNMKYCTMLMNTLLDEENIHCSNALKSDFGNNGKVIKMGMADYYLDTSASQFKDDLHDALAYYDPDWKRYHKVPIDILYPYGCGDADYCLSLKHALIPILKENNLLSTYHKIVMPLSNALMHLELHGCPLNIEKAKKVEIDQNKIMEENAPLIHEIVGKKFDVSSSTQLGRVLFEEMKLPGGERNKNGWVTDAEALQKLNHPIVEPLLKYRRAQKIGSTYAKAALELVSETSENGKIGWVHPEIRQDSKTGRLKCKDPNLTNLPRPENGGDIVKSIWECPKGYVFLFKDFSQIELRVVAHISGEPTWVDGFNNGYDMHAAMAHTIWSLPCSVEEVGKLYKSYRSKAKAINFGIIYGESVWALSQKLDLTYDEADDLVNKEYFGTAPTLKKWVDTMHLLAESTGEVRNIFNRIRHLPNAQTPVPKGLPWPKRGDRPECYRKCVKPKDIGVASEHIHTIPAANIKQNIKLFKQYDHYKCCDCPNLVSCFINSEVKYLEGKKKAALRQSVNSCVQGSAADMSSLALIWITQEFKRHKVDARPVLYIHDEIGCYTNVKDLEKAERIMEDCMVRKLQEVTQFRVPLVTDTEVHKCWGDKK